MASLMQHMKSNDELRKTMVVNIHKMLMERKLMDIFNVGLSRGEYIDLSRHDAKIIIDEDEYYARISNDVVYNNANSIIIINIEGTETYIFEVPEGMIDSKNIKKFYYDIIEGYQNKNKIIIFPNDLTKIPELIEDDSVEIFKKSFFLINIIDMICSPVYHHIKAVNINIFTNEYGISNLGQLPKISIYDQASLYYGVKLGDMFRLIRSNKSCISIGYRIVCNINII